MRLSADQRDQIDCMLRILIPQTPANSRVTLTLVKKEHEFEGTLQIKSFSQNFYSEIKTNSPLLTYRLLEHDMRNQLQEWKNNRFLSSCFGENFIKSKEVVA